MAAFRSPAPIQRAEAVPGRRRRSWRSDPEPPAPAPHRYGAPPIGRPARPLRFRRQHERGQVQPRLQHITDPGLAPDRYPLADKVGDVAIDGPLGSLELGGEGVGGYRSRRAPQDLNDVKKPVGGSHEPLSPNNADSMVAAG